MKQEKQKEKERLEKLLLDRLKQEKEMQERQKVRSFNTCIKNLKFPSLYFMDFL